MIGIGIIGTLMNTYGAKHLPILEGIVLIVHIFGFFCIIIPLWVLAPKAPPSEVFGTFSDFGGWSSIGAACFVGSITATGSFAGSDVVCDVLLDRLNTTFPFGKFYANAESKDVELNRRLMNLEW